MALTKNLLNSSLKIRGYNYIESADYRFYQNNGTRSDGMAVRLVQRYNTNSINLEIAAFHIDIENLVAAGRGTVFKNLGKVQTMGLEVGSSLYLSLIHI